MITSSIRKLRGVAAFAAVALIASCSASNLTVPSQGYYGDVDAVSVRSTLAGIEVVDDEACPWIGDHVLLVVSKDASVDPSGPVLLSGGTRIGVGDAFESGPLMELKDGFDCGGKHWDNAVQLPSAPLLVG